MSFLTKLTKVNDRAAKRLGRGGGSGKGFHTVGRGQKGQKTRGTIPVWFEGGQLPLIRRTPFIRGKRRFKSLKGDAVIVTLKTLNKFKANSSVDAKAVVETLKISQKWVDKAGIKVVATGKLEKALKVNLPASAAAAKAIEKAGGTIAARSEA